MSLVVTYTNDHDGSRQRFRFDSVAKSQRFLGRMAELKDLFGWLQPIMEEDPADGNVEPQYAVMIMAWLKRFDKMVNKYGTVPDDVVLRKLIATDWLMAWIAENTPTGAITVSV